MCKAEQLRDKLTNDYMKYREKALQPDKETILNNSFYNAICGEWQCYLESWFACGNGNAGFEERVIDMLLSLDNIFEKLTDYAGKQDNIELNSESFFNTLNEFVAENG